MAKESDRDEEETGSAETEETEGAAAGRSDDVDEESGRDDAAEGSDEGEESDEDEADEESDGDDDADDDDEDEDEGDEEPDGDEDADEELAAAAERGATAKAGAAKRKTGRRRTKKKSARQTAGSRLAAARAAKAARKAAKLGKEKKEEKEPIEAVRQSEIAQRAQEAGEWAQKNRSIVYAIAAVLVLGLGGWIGYHYYATGQAEAAAGLLREALEVRDAPIRAEDAPAPDDEDAPSFTSVEQRAEAALEAFQQVLSQHPGSEAAPWASLGAGNALLELGRYEEARVSFEGAIASGGQSSTILWHALEGKGFAHEGEEQWDQALEVYRELSRIDDGRFDAVAKYHIARMYIAQDQPEQATETLSGVVEQLRQAEDDEDRTDFSYVLAQAEVRLRELDPSAAPERPSLRGGGPSQLLGGGGGAGGQQQQPQLSQEQIQELIRRMQQKQGGGAGGAGAGGGAGGAGAGATGGAGGATGGAGGATGATEPAPE